MSDVRLERNVWSGAAVVLVAAALIALVTVLSGPYSSTDSNIVYTLAAALLGASTLVSGRALVSGCVELVAMRSGSGLDVRLPPGERLVLRQRL